MMLMRRELLGGVKDPYTGKTVIEITLSEAATVSFYSIAGSSYSVDRGDGTTSATKDHSYTSSGTFVIVITGATGVYAGWGSIKSYVTKVLSVGEDITTIDNAFSQCTNLTEFDSGSGNHDMITRAESAFFKCSNLTKITTRNGFCRNVANMSAMFKECSKVSDVTICDGFGYSATNINTAFSYWNASGVTCDLVLPDGFGRVATDLSSLFLVFSAYSATKTLSLPSGFGSCATNVADMFGYANQLNTLTMHGSANGIPISFSLQYSPLTVASVLTVLETLPVVATTQTLTLKSSMKTTYEASSDFMTKKSEIEARGWVIAYA